MIVRHILCITGLVAMCAFAVPQAQAQDSYDGIRLSWTGSLDPVKDSLLLPTARHPALTINVYESNSRQALRLLGADLRSRGTRLSGNRPARASGLTLEGTAMGALDLMVVAEHDRHGDASLTLAFQRDERSVDHDDPGLRAAVREIAVRLNRAVVNEQIEDLRKRQGRVESREESARKSEARLLKQQNKANKDLQRIKQRQSRQQRNNANMQRDAARFDARFNRTGNPRFLQRATRQRRQLAQGERRMGRLMRDEARKQSDLVKIERDLVKSREDQRSQGLAKRSKEDALQLLQRKLEAIH
jgi:hypothetical protein